MSFNPLENSRLVVMALRPLIFLGLGIYFLTTPVDLGYLSAYVADYVPGLLCVVYAVGRLWYVWTQFQASKHEND